MKNSESKKTAPTRTVKIKDTIHHKVRVLSAQKRISVQRFVEKSLKKVLDEKLYEQFDAEQVAA